MTVHDKHCIRCHLATDKDKCPRCKRPTVPYRNDKFNQERLQ